MGEANTEIIGTVDPDQLRFRAKALQADLRLLKPGLPARVVPPEVAASSSAQPRRLEPSSFP